MKKIEERMMTLLDGHVIKHPTTFDLTLSVEKDVYARAAQILAVGLHQDLPDDLDSAVQQVLDIVKELITKKRPLVKQALHMMGRKAKVVGLLNTIKKEIK